MTDVDLILAALTAGATAGISDTASSVIRDAYAGLREAIRHRLAQQGKGAVQALDGDKSKPEVWQPRLREELLRAGLDQDERIVAVARELLAHLRLSDEQSAGYVVNLRDAKGLQVGDHNTQTNTFS